MFVLKNVGYYNHETDTLLALVMCMVKDKALQLEFWDALHEKFWIYH